MHLPKELIVRTFMQQPFEVPEVVISEEVS